jgi:hypothetical protein
MDIQSTSIPAVHELTETELNETIETIQKLDEVFGWLNRKNPPAPKIDNVIPKRNEIVKKDMDDDIPDEADTIKIDHFNDDTEIVKFVKMLANVQNLKNLQNKRDCLEAIRKFKELFDVVKIAFPFLKTRARDFGLVIPTLNETGLKDKIKDVFNN